MIGQPRRLAVVLGAAVVALGLAVAVQASIPDGGGVIHGCYSRVGLLRVIDTAGGAKCLPFEQALDWNARGPIGPQGPAGPQGPKGDKGDPGATYDAGAGLALAGTTFGVLGSYQLPQGCSSGQSPFFLGAPLTHPWSCFTAANAGPGETCAGGKFVNGIDNSGNVTCDTPGAGGGSPGPEAWVARTAGAVDVPENGLWTTILSLSLPAGTYVIDGGGEATDDTGGNNEVSMRCRVQDGLAGVSNLERFINADTVNGVAPVGAFAMHDIVTFPASTTIDLACNDAAGSDHLEDAELTTLKLGTVH